MAVMTCTAMAQTNLELAQRAYDDGDMNTAWQYLTKQCDDDCTTGTKYLMMRVLSNVDEHTYAAKFATKVLEELPNTPENKIYRSNCWVTMGIGAFEAGEMKLAKKAYTFAMKEDPQNEWPYFERALVFLKQKNLNKAMKDINKALELDTAYLDAYLMKAYLWEDMGSVTEANKCYEKAISITEGKNGRVLAEYAVGLCLQGDSLRGVKMLCEAMAVDPTRPRVGRAYNQIIGKHPHLMLDEARERAVADPRNAEWEAIIGDIYDETLNLPDSGFVHYRKGFLIDPLFDNGFNLASRLYKRCMSIDDYEMAEQLMQEVLIVSPTDKPARQRLIAAAHAQQHLDVMLERINDLMTSAEDSTDLLAQRSRCYYDLGRYDEAQADLMVVAKDNADSRFVNYHLGRCNEALGNKDQAMVNYYMVVKESSKFYDASSGEVNINIGADGSIAPMELPLALYRMDNQKDAEAVLLGTMLTISMAAAKEGVQLDGNKIYNVACAVAQVMSDKSMALDMLALAIKHGYTQVEYIAIDPDFQSVRESTDPDIRARWEKLLDDQRQLNAEQRATLRELIK